MRENKSLEKILEGFMTKTDAGLDSRSRQAVTIWVSPEVKARYDQLQKASGRCFSKKAKEALLALISMAESRAS